MLSSTCNVHSTRNEAWSIISKRHYVQNLFRPIGQLAAAGIVAFALAACGGGNGAASASSGSSSPASSATPASSSVAPASSTGAAQVSTLAGSGATGKANGQGTAASFNDPVGVVVDANGAVYVADTGNHLIRKIDASGNVTTLAGSGAAGSANGQGTAASFDFPNRIAIDKSGIVYVADSGNSLIRKIDTSGHVTTLAGSGVPGSANGQGTAASFNFPTGIAVDASGNLYVADAGNNLIRKIDTSGNVTTLAGSGAAGAANGVGTAASFNAARGIAVDAGGNVYVADTSNNLIRKIDTSGNVTTLAGAGAQGAANGQGTAASFNGPYGLVVDANGNLYVADTDNNLIRKIDVSGNVTTVAGAGQGSANGQGTAASFFSPSGVAVDASGNLYVADTLNNLIRKIVVAQ
jgi:sugar lactone lactonase YvrE